MKKWKALLSAVAALCTLSMFTACGIGSGNSDTGSTDTGSTDIVDTGSTDTGSTDTGSTDTGSTDTGSTDTPVTPATYTVTFVDEDGTPISEKTYEEGAIVDEPEAPTKAADNTYTYTFAGWDKKVTAVTDNVTYTATYTSTYIDYLIKFVNDDDSLIAEKTYHYGDTVEIPAPTKAADNTYTYTFAGWDKEVVTTVAGEATYKATYTSNFIEYSVKFLADDGSLISEKNDYHYGDDVSVPSDPEKAATEYFTYAFAGWSSEVVLKVAGDATYTAKFDGTLKSGYNANKVTAGVGDGVVLGAGEIGGGANYTLGQQNDDGDETPSFVRQSYLALDGNYGLNDYVALDFTGKNMPEIAFFAKNYNDSMYAEGTSKQGIVVTTGITTYNGQLESGVNGNGTQINYGFPYMIQDASNGGFVEDAFANSALGRANLVDGTHYRVIMGFTEHAESARITLKWYLYNLDTNTVVEEGSMSAWGFFNGSTAQVGNMTRDQLLGSIVLYGKFGTACAIDKIHGVFEDTTIENIANGLNSDKTYTVTFKNANGEEMKKVEGVKFGETVSYDGEMPTPEKAEDALFTYAYAWDKTFGRITVDTVYSLKLVSTPKSGIQANNVSVNGDEIVLGAGNIGDGANYTHGQNNGGFVHQSYLGLDGNYGLNNYVVFDFTGKNLPEIAFFAKNYNDSMYAEGTSKQGIVVVTGITTWDGKLESGVNGNGTQINYGFPYMIQDAGNGGFVQDAFANSKLGRANLEDGTHYRVIMGFTEHAESARITLKWYLYNLDTNTVVEESSMSAWGFFSGSNAQAGNMTRDQLSGSIVLYGKFGATCTIDKIHGVESGAYADIVAKYTKA